MDKSTFLVLLGGSSPLLILGIVFLVIGLIRASRIRQWIPAEGVIVKKDKGINIRIDLGTILNRSIKSRSETMPDQKPTVSYTVDGVKYEKKSIIGQTPGIPPGKVVNVLYDPRDPKNAVINTFIQKGAIFTVIGCACLGLYILIAAFFTVIWNAS